MADLWRIEREALAQGAGRIAGVDEAGRGPLAGPVYAAAVILPQDLELSGLNDSKKLSAKKREQLFSLITECAITYGIGVAGEAEIDEINILQATFLAMRRAMQQLDPAPDLVLVDGNRLGDFPYPCRAIVGGDGLSANIAAASILAKVSRDRYMEALSVHYPQYGFEAHKGYGTKAHYAALAEYGPCPAHRRSFLKKFYGAQ